MAVLAGCRTGRSQVVPRKDSMPAAVGVTLLPHPNKSFFRMFSSQSKWHRIGCSSPSTWPTEVFCSSSEDGLSFVLFFKVAYDFVGIIIYVWLNVGLPQFSSCIIFAHQILSVGQCSTQCRSSPSSLLCRSGRRTGGSHPTQDAVSTLLEPSVGRK